MRSRVSAPSWFPAPTERNEARALISELLGQHVKIRQEGKAAYARLEMDTAVLLVAGGKPFETNDFKRGSGGGRF
jgi:hypothetical protein